MCLLYSERPNVTVDALTALSTADASLVAQPFRHSNSPNRWCMKIALLGASLDFLKFKAFQSIIKDPPPTLTTTLTCNPTHRIRDRARSLASFK